MSDSPASVDSTAIGFANLGALRTAHARLVKHQGAGEATDEFLDEVEGFLICAQDTGRVLAEEEERIAAQTIIDYWGTVMLRARRPLPEATTHGLAEFAAPSAANASLRDQSVGDYFASERSALRSRLRLSAAAAQWAESGREDGLLWGGSQLREAESYKDLSAAESEFLAASRAYEAQLQRAAEEQAAFKARVARNKKIVRRIALAAAAFALVFQSLRERAVRQKEQHELAAKLVERASVSARDGDIAGSLLWLAQAWQKDADAGMPLDVHRVRLGAAIAQLPKLTQLLIEENPNFICNSAEFSPDGKFILTVANALDGSGGAARLWDSASGKKVVDFPSVKERLNYATFSGAGGVITLTGEAGTKQGGARLWDLNGKQLLAFEELTTPVLYAAFSPGGKLVALVVQQDAQASTVEVRDAATGKSFTGPLGWGGPIKHVAFSPDGNYIVACGSAAGEGRLKIWNAWDGAESCVESLAELRLPVNFAVFSDDSTTENARIATGCGEPGSGRGAVQVWEPFTGNRRFARAHRAPVNAVAFSPGGQRLMILSQDDTVDVCDANAGTTLQQLRHESSVTGAKYSPDGRFIITGSRDHTARVWRAATGELELPPLNLGRTVATPSFSPDGERMLAAAPDAARLWLMATGEPTTPVLKVEDSVHHSTISDDGNLVAAVSESGEIGSWNLRTGETTSYKTWRAEKAPEIFFSPDATLFLVPTKRDEPPHDDLAAVWKTQSNKRVGEVLKHEAPVSCAAFSPDGKYVLTSCVPSASANATVRIWEAATGQIVGKPLLVTGKVSFAIFTPDSRHVLTAGGTSDPPRGEARVWRVPSGDAATPPLSHRETVRHASFNTKLDRVITAGTDDHAKFWKIDLARGEAQELRDLAEHSADLVRAAFSPDKAETLAVTAGFDRMAVLWAPETDTRRAVLQHPGWINDAGFSADGRFLVTAGADGTARVWEAKTGDFVALFRHDGEVQRALFSPEGNVVTLSSYEPARTLLDAQRDLFPSSAALSGLDDPRAKPVRRVLVKAQIWRLPPAPDSVGQLQSFAELMRSRRIHPENSRDLIAFDRKQLSGLWAGLQPDYATCFLNDIGGRAKPIPTTQPPVKVVALATPKTTSVSTDVSESSAPTTGSGLSLTGLHAVDESEAAGQWLAARWHLDQLLRADATNADLLARRAVAFAQSGAWKDAAADYTSALALHPNDRNLFARRARVYAELEQWQDALADASTVIDAAPADAKKDTSIHPRRAGAYAALGKWEEAAADLLVAKESGAAGAYRRLAAIRLKQTNLTAYQALCAEMWQHPEFLTGELASTTAWTCVVGPGAVPDPDRLVEMAREPLKQAPDRHAFRNNLGAALYRAGQFPEAIRELDLSRKTHAQELSRAQAVGEAEIGPLEDGRPQDWVFLAMAYAGNGDAAAARGWFDKLDSWLNRGKVRLGGEGIWERLELEILRDEARTVLHLPNAAP